MLSIGTLVLVLNGYLARGCGVKVKYAPGGFTPAAWASPNCDNAVLPDINETVLIRRGGALSGTAGES